MTRARSSGILAAMATSKRPALRKHDRVTLSRIKSVIPAYDDKPFVGRDMVLTVSHLTGTGSKRNPWHVVVTDGTHFWHLEPDDVVRVETAGMSSHSTVKRDLDSWLDRHGYTRGHSYAVSSRMAHAIRVEHLFTYRNKHGSWSNVWATDAEHAKQQISKRKDAPGSFFTISRVTNVPPRENAASHARVIHQEPTGRPVFAEHERHHHITTSGRRALAASQFALPPGPEEKRRGIRGRLPIDTIARARNALARAAQMRKSGHLSEGQLQTVRRKVHAAWPSIDSAS